MSGGSQRALDGESPAQSLAVPDTPLLALWFFFFFSGEVVLRQHSLKAACALPVKCDLKKKAEKEEKRKKKSINLQGITENPGEFLG